MRVYLKFFILFLFTVSSSVSFGYARPNAEVSEERSGSAALAWIHNNCDNMSPPLPVDEYMRCVESGGRLSFRDFRIQLKVHPVLARSDCYQIIDEQRFMNCLDAYIRNRGLSESDQRPEGATETRVERLAEI